MVGSAGVAVLFGFCMGWGVVVGGVFFLRGWGDALLSQFELVHKLLSIPKVINVWFPNCHWEIPLFSICRRKDSGFFFVWWVF